MATQTKPRAERTAQGAPGRAAIEGLEPQGLKPRGELRWNSIPPELVQAAIRRGEGELADMGPFVAVTSPHTGRSPNDKFVVKEPRDRKSTRLNSSHLVISYAVFCLKKNNRDIYYY